MSISYDTHDTHIRAKLMLKTLGEITDALDPSAPKRTDWITSLLGDEDDHRDRLIADLYRLALDARQLAETLRHTGGFDDALL